MSTPLKELKRGEWLKERGVLIAVTTNSGLNVRQKNDDMAHAIQSSILCSLTVQVNKNYARSEMET